VIFQIDANELAIRDVVMRSQPHGAVPRIQHSPCRRGSEPFYVNVPHAGLKGAVSDEDVNRELRMPDDNGRYDELSSEILINDHAEVFEEANHLLSEKDARRKLLISS
jgi:hypothetical protein